jgi:hypothetical protein
MHDCPVQTGRRKMSKRVTIVRTPPWMQAESFIGYGMWSGADVCPASKCGSCTPRALMEVRGPGPLRLRALKDARRCAGLPDPVF